MSEPETPDRARISLLRKSRRWIDALVKTQRYGWDHQEVIRRFIDAGINAAIDKGDITKADGEEPPPP